MCQNNMNNHCLLFSRGAEIFTKRFHTETHPPLQQQCMRQYLLWSNFADNGSIKGLSVSPNATQSISDSGEQTQVPRPQGLSATQESPQSSELRPGVVLKSLRPSSSHEGKFTMR